jgi:hypothetical protein
LHHGLLITTGDRASLRHSGGVRVPQIVAVAGMLFSGGMIVVRLVVIPATAPAVAGAGAGGRHPSTAGDAFKVTSENVHFDIQADYGDLDTRTILQRAAVYFAWLLFFFAAAGLVGLLPAMFLFLVGYMRFEGKESWTMTLTVAGTMWLGCYALFHKLLVVPWPQTIVGDWFPSLRSDAWLNLL